MAVQFLEQPLFGTLSKALAKSRKTTSNGLPSSTIVVAFSRNSNRLVAQDLPLLRMIDYISLQQDSGLGTLVCSFQARFLILF